MACFCLLAMGQRPESYKNLRYHEVKSALTSPKVFEESKETFWMITCFMSKTSNKNEAPLEILIDDKNLHSLLTWYGTVLRPKVMNKENCKDKDLPFFYSPRSKDKTIEMSGSIQRKIQQELNAKKIIPYMHLRKIMASTIRKTFERNPEACESMLRAEGHSTRTVDKYYDVYRQQRQAELKQKVLEHLHYQPSKTIVNIDAQDLFQSQNETLHKSRCTNEPQTPGSSYHDEGYRKSPTTPGSPDSDEAYNKLFGICGGRTVFTLFEVAQLLQSQVGSEYRNLNISVGLLKVSLKIQ